MDSNPNKSPATITACFPAVAILASASRPEPTRRSLAADLARFIGELKARYPDRLTRRPRAFKARLMRLIDHQLPPYPRAGGRPRSALITRAAEMYKTQRQAVLEGKQRGVNWNTIALECITGYRQFRSDVHRRDVLNKLRNSVYARLRRKRTNKRKLGLSRQNTPTVC